MRPLLAQALQPSESEAGELRDHVIIAGFGRVGQIIGQLLSERLIPFVALDLSSDRVQVRLKSCALTRCCKHQAAWAGLPLPSTCARKRNMCARSTHAARFLARTIGVRHRFRADTSPIPVRGHTLPGPIIFMNEP